MTDTLLIAPPDATAAAAAPTAPTFVQRLLRGGVLRALAGLRSGGLRVCDALGEARRGDAAGPFGELPLEVADPSFWSAVAARGSLGAGEAYVRGQWRTRDLVALLRLFVRDRDVLQRMDGAVWTWPQQWLLRLHHALRDNSRHGSRRNIADHYDLGDELFACFLDPSLTYSSAWFAHAGQSLEAAQQEKLRRLCRLVDLSPGDRLLEIGTGWGSLALCAAGEFGARVTTTTISQNQFAKATARVQAAGLQQRVELRRQDYRDLDGTYDKLLSCEMIEAVGAKWLPTYLKTCAARLRPGGVLGLQAIVIDDRHYASALRHVDYIKRHVFPGSFIPSVQAIHAAATAHTDLRLVRVEEFGRHYATTLQRWREALFADPAPFLRVDPTGALLRAWEFYFAYCEAGFRERQLGVVHLRFERAAPLRD